MLKLTTDRQTDWTKIHVFVKPYAPGGNKVLKTVLVQRLKSRLQGH